MAFIETDSFEIVDNSTKTQSTFLLILSESNECIMRSILNLKCLLGCTVSNNYQHLKFHGRTITTLDKILGNVDDKQMDHFFFSIGNQLKYLINECDCCFSYFDPKHMLVIDNVCICLSLLCLHSIDTNGRITINAPFKKTCFQSPEVNLIKSLPSKIHLQCIYYSLACIVIYNMNPKILVYSTSKELIRLIEPLHGSKLYYALLRCLAEVPEERTLLYI